MLFISCNLKTVNHCAPVYWVRVWSIKVQSIEILSLSDTF